MPPDQVQSGSSRQAGAPVALRHIVKNFDNYRAIDDLSLDIEPGEFITFLGPVRLRQVDHADDDRRLRAADGG